MPGTRPSVAPPSWTWALGAWPTCSSRSCVGRPSFRGRFGLGFRVSGLGFKGLGFKGLGFRVPSMESGDSPREGFYGVKVPVIPEFSTKN